MPKIDLTKRSKPSLKPLDQCKGISPEGHEVMGQYMNSEGQYAWIRGHYLGKAITGPREAIKVLTQSLSRV